MLFVMKDGSCAIRCHEPCQAGDRAALSGFSDVPQACLSGAETAVTRIFVLSIDVAWSDFVPQYFFTEVWCVPGVIQKMASSGF